MSVELSVKDIGQRIYFIRGHRVMLDSDLADLYGVETKALKRAVRRNVARFPDDFMFEISQNELENLRYQFGTSSFAEKQHGGLRYLPFVFTQEGVAMLSGVLSSDRAVQVNIAIMRAFVKMREMLETHKDLAAKLDKLERKVLDHDEQFRAVFAAIRQLMAVGAPVTQKRIKGIGE